MAFGPGTDQGTSVSFSGTASEVSVDTSEFDRNLSALDENVQAALETLDDLIATGEGGGYGYFPGGWS